VLAINDGKIETEFLRRLVLQFAAAWTPTPPQQKGGAIVCGQKVG
jgi:hypothetical protein